MQRVCQGAERMTDSVAFRRWPAFAPSRRSCSGFAERNDRCRSKGRPIQPGVPAATSKLVRKRPRR